MRKLLISIAAVVLGGCSSTATWQIAPGSTGARAMLLNTVTGETWVQNYGSSTQPWGYWIKMGPRFATTQP
jgi:uncharacterized protein YceK